MPKGRPKKVKTEEAEIVEETKVEEPTPVESTPIEPIPVEPTPAPVIPEPPKPEPPKFESERLAEGNVVYATRLPMIKAGVCEFCGGGVYDTGTSPMTLKEDWRVDPLTQIGKCKHYNGVRIRCSYCPLSADFIGNIRARDHNVFVSPYNPNQLIIHCNDMICTQKHVNRFSGGK